MTLKIGTASEVVSATDVVKQTESAGRNIGYSTPVREALEKKEEPDWPTFLEKASDDAIKERLSAKMSEVLKTYGLENDCCLALFEPEDSIDSYDLDRVFTALKEINPLHSKRVVLFVISAGGSIEPAYQISKLCKSFALGKFVVVVTRHAKSAATMIAIGADEIHMGPLGQLGL